MSAATAPRDDAFASSDAIPEKLSFFQRRSFLLPGPCFADSGVTARPSRISRILLIATGR